jgi:hypothetical protein
VTVLTWRSAENRGFGHQRAKEDQVTRGNAGDRMQGTPEFGSQLHFTDSDAPAAPVRRLVKNCPRHVRIPPLQPVSVMCAHYQLAGDEQIAFNPAAQQTFSPTRGCSRMLPLNPSGAVLPLPMRGGPFSLDTSITSRRRGEPADPASVATIRVTGNPPYSNPSCSSRHGTREQLGAFIVMVGTVGRAGFLRTGNGRSFRIVGFPRGREL